MQANFVINLGNKSHVPIISFSATSPSLASLRSPYFFQAAQSASFQVKAISAIVQAFGWREVVPIYVDDLFGESLIPYLTDALQEINIRIPYLTVIPASATDDQIDEELYKLFMTVQTRVFIVHMTMSLGSRVLPRAKEIGMMSEGYVWIMTDTMTALWRSTNASAIDSLQGILGVRTHVPKSEKLQNFEERWKRKFQQDNPNITNAELNIFGLWAYDATFALAMAIEKAGTANLGFNKTNISASGVTDLETLGVSQNGPQLIQELSSANFTGLSGDFHFVNRQLQSSVFDIVNVIGTGERNVGFWTPENGLVRKLDLTNTSTNSTSKPKLGPIIWPGDTNLVPKGWEIPTNGKKLRILVPVKVGFTEFVDVEWDTISQKAKSIKGYCIDIFDAVMAKMPYGVPYEYVPFATLEGKPAGPYNDLIDQVYYGNYDAGVGDIAIVANRSLFVEYTLPYTESGVTMVVPIKDNRKKNAWAFLKPLAWNLWVTTASFFVFIGFVVWLLEHRINDEFRGPPAHQVGTSLWFSFSTMVFAHRENVVNNLARVVVIIWCFVVVILAQSYTASLSSRLTVEQLQPTVTDLNKLLKRRESVGVQNGSFIKGILLDRLKCHQSQLKIFHTPEELHELFTKGSANGGISAALDGILYMKLFLAKYCGKYTTVETSYKTDGVGFVFPKGSPLVPDVSRAILNVTQSDKLMEQIQHKWFYNETVCPDFDPSISSHSLGLESFGGLFLIAGFASLSAVIIFAAMFLYEQRHVMLNSETPMWERIRIMLRNFDQRDLSSHTYRKSDLENRSGHVSVQSIGIAGASPNTNSPPSPPSYSNQTERDSEFSVNQGRASENGDLTPSGMSSPRRNSIELGNTNEPREQSL
ncbi:hypothetical protein PTKIN_Ptkin03bG0172300 [Pterospermum kingtungense]